MDDRHRQFAQYATALNQQLTGSNSGGNDRTVRERSGTDGRSSTGSTSSGSSNSSGGGGAAAAAAAVAAAAVGGNTAIWGELSRALQYNYPGFSSGTGWAPPPHQGGSDFHRFGGYGYGEGSNEGRNMMEGNRTEGRRVPSKGETKVTPPLPAGMGSTIASLEHLVTNDQVYRTIIAQQYAAAAALSALPPSSRTSLSPIPASNRSTISPNQIHNPPPMPPRHHQHLEHMSNQLYHQQRQQRVPHTQPSPPAQMISPNFPSNSSTLSTGNGNINGEYMDTQVCRMPPHSQMSAHPQISPHNSQKERMMEQLGHEQLHHARHPSPKSSSISPIERYPPHDVEKEASCIYENDAQKQHSANMRSYDGGFRSGSESEGDQRSRHRRKQDQPRRQSVIYSHTAPQPHPSIPHNMSAESSSDDSQGYDTLLERPMANHNEIPHDPLASNSPSVERERTDGGNSMSQAMSHALAHPFLAAHLNTPESVSIEKKVETPPQSTPAPPTMHIGDVPEKRIYVKDHRELCEPTDSPPSTSPPHPYFDNCANFMVMPRQQVSNCLDSENHFNDPSISIRTSQPNCINIECSGPVKKRKLSQNCHDYMDPRNSGPCIRENQSELPLLPDGVVSSCENFISSEAEKFSETVLNGNIFENRDITITEVRNEVPLPKDNVTRNEHKQDKIVENQMEQNSPPDLLNGIHIRHSIPSPPSAPPPPASIPTPALSPIPSPLPHHPPTPPIVPSSQPLHPIQEHPKPTDELESPPIDGEHRRRTRQKRPVSYVEDETDPVLETIEDFSPILSPVKKKGRKSKEKLDVDNQGHLIEMSPALGSSYGYHPEIKGPVSLEKISHCREESPVDGIRDKLLKANKYIPSSIKEPLHIDTNSTASSGPPALAPILHSPDIYDFNDDSENTAKGKKGKRGRKRGSPRRPHVSSPEFFRSHLSPRSRDRSSSKSPRSPKFFNSRSETIKVDTEAFLHDVTKSSSQSLHLQSGPMNPSLLVDGNGPLNVESHRINSEKFNCQNKNSSLLEEVEANIAAFHRFTDQSGEKLTTVHLPNNNDPLQRSSTSNEDQNLGNEKKSCSKPFKADCTGLDKSFLNHETHFNNSHSNSNIVNQNDSLSEKTCPPPSEPDKLTSLEIGESKSMPKAYSDNYSDGKSENLSEENTKCSISCPKDSIKNSVHDGYKNILEKSFHEEQYTHSSSNFDIKSFNTLADNIPPIQSSVHVASVPDAPQNDAKQNSGRNRKRTRGRPRADSDRSTGSYLSDNDPLPSNSPESGISGENSALLEESSPRLRRSLRSSNSQKNESSSSTVENDEKDANSFISEDPCSNTENLPIATTSTTLIGELTPSSYSLCTQTSTEVNPTVTVTTNTISTPVNSDMTTLNPNILVNAPDCSNSESGGSFNDINLQPLSLPGEHSLPSDTPDVPSEALNPTSSLETSNVPSSVVAPTTVTTAATPLCSLQQPLQLESLGNSASSLQQLDPLACSDETEAETVENIAKFLEATAPITSETKSAKINQSSEDLSSITPNSSFMSDSTINSTPSTSELSYREARPKRVSRPPPEMNDGEMNDLLLLLNMEDEESEDEDYIPKDTEAGDSDGNASLDEDENEASDSDDLSSFKNKSFNKKSGSDKNISEGISKKKQGKSKNTKERKKIKSKYFSEKKSNEEDRRRDDSKKRSEERPDKKAPFIRLGGMRELESIINVPDKDEDDKEKNSRKISIPFYLDMEVTLKNPRIGFNSTLHNNYDAFNKDLSWFCAFCKNYSHYRTLGDLFGPLFVKGLNVVKKNYPEVIEGQVMDVSLSPAAMTSMDASTSFAHVSKARNKRTPRHDSYYEQLEGKKPEIGGISPPSRFVPSATPARMVGRPSSSVPSTPEGSGKLTSPRMMPTSPMRLDAGVLSANSSLPPQQSSKNLILTSERHSSSNEITDSSPSGTECWLHETCILWASGVSVSNSKLNGLEEAVLAAQESVCSHCGETGATVCCLGRGCSLIVHVPCARCLFWDLDEKTFQSHCPKHILKTGSCPKEKVQQAKP